MMPNDDPEAPVVMPITDELDLHTFLPKDLPDLLDDYFEACVERGILSVRVIHGKGSGALRRGVEAILRRHPRVATFEGAPPDAGGWGATLVDLKPTGSEPENTTSEGS
jgi:DNA-nicking Smr family endonuclease